jgi:hypothetical protein
MSREIGKKNKKILLRYLMLYSYFFFPEVKGVRIVVQDAVLPDVTPFKC